MQIKCYSWCRQILPSWCPNQTEKSVALEAMLITITEINYVHLHATWDRVKYQDLGWVHNCMSWLLARQVIMACNWPPQKIYFNLWQHHSYWKMNKVIGFNQFLSIIHKISICTYTSFRCFSLGFLCFLWQSCFIDAFNNK